MKEKPEMVDRVARVMFEIQSGGPGQINSIIWHELNEKTRNLWHSFARTVIAAMREPTEEMINAGIAAGDKAYGQRPAFHGYTTTNACWQAMIDEALKCPK